MTSLKYDVLPDDDQGAPRLGPLILGFSGAAGVLFTALVWIYAQHGAPIVQRMDRALGMILLEEGERLEAAGEYENAADCYRLALQGEFEAHKYRTYTLKRLGALLWWREGPESALPYLEEAYRQSDAPITLYEPLCDSLLRVGRVDAILPITGRWYKEAEQAGHPDQQALALYYEGKVYQAQGDADRALESFLAGTGIRPGGSNAYELGLAYYHAGRFDEALKYLEQFLETGSGGRVQYARTLREEILERTAGRAAP